MEEEWISEANKELSKVIRTGRKKQTRNGLVIVTPTSIRIVEVIKDN